METSTTNREGKAGTSDLLLNAEASMMIFLGIECGHGFHHRAKRGVSCFGVSVFAAHPFEYMDTLEREAVAS